MKALTRIAIAISVIVGLMPVGGAANAAFPGSNGLIAFQSNRDGPVEIYAITPGGTADRITFSNGSSDPAYSPDGSKIAFVGGTNYQIVVMNADGSGVTQVTSTSPAKQDPTWSADGTRIAFAANSFNVDGQTDLEIWVINADGSGGATQLTNNTFPDTHPAWSPDGNKIAFVATRPGDTDRNIYMMNADGSGQTNITPNVLTDCSPPTPETCYQGHDDDPAWSPDGSRIAYVHSQEPNASGLPAVWTMYPTGANKGNLSNNPAVSFDNPAWSPQGDMLAAVGTATPTTNRDIWVMNSDGSGQTAIDTNPAFDINPDWQPVPTVPSPAPTITAFKPTSGPPGTRVVLRGSGFTGATEVRFNGVSAPFVVRSDSKIETLVPRRATTGPISVTTPEGTGMSTTDFTVT